MSDTPLLFTGSMLIVMIGRLFELKTQNIKVKYSTSSIYYIIFLYIFKRVASYSDLCWMPGVYLLHEQEQNSKTRVYEGLNDFVTGEQGGVAGRGRGSAGTREGDFDRAEEGGSGREFRGEQMEG